MTRYTPQLTQDKRQARREAILAEIQAGRPVAEIAADWMVTEDYVRHIGRRGGHRWRGVPQPGSLSKLVEAAMAGGASAADVARWSGLSRAAVHQIQYRARRRALAQAAPEPP